MFPTLIRKNMLNPSCGMAAVETELGDWSLNEEDAR